MKNPVELLKQKTIDLENYQRAIPRLQEDIKALRNTIPLLLEEGENILLPPEPTSSSYTNNKRLLGPEDVMSRPRA